MDLEAAASGRSWRRRHRGGRRRCHRVRQRGCGGGGVKEEADREVERIKEDTSRRTVGGEGEKEAAVFVKNFSSLAVKVHGLWGLEIFKAPP